MEISFAVNGKTSADNMARMMQRSDVRAILARLQELEKQIAALPDIRVTITARIDLVEGK